jgi:hypothetical protein
MPRDNKPTVLITSFMLLTRLNDEELAALNCALMLHREVDRENQAFEKCLRFGLIHSNGKPKDLESLKTAADQEATQRMKKGKF